VVLQTREHIPLAILAVHAIGVTAGNDVQDFLFIGTWAIAAAMPD